MMHIDVEQSCLTYCVALADDLLRKTPRPERFLAESDA